MYLELHSVSRHNPYFNRWFSAIRNSNQKFQSEIRHNPYFNRWFSAIFEAIIKQLKRHSHNPYFNRWFSAIKIGDDTLIINVKSQSLF